MIGGLKNYNLKRTTLVQKGKEFSIDMTVMCLLHATIF